MTSRRDNSPNSNASKARIVALEAELAAALTQAREAQATTPTLAAERAARESMASELADERARHAELGKKHAELERKHALLVDEYERLKAFLKAYASEHRCEKRLHADARQLKLLFDNSPELAAARETALAEAAKLVESHKARSATRQRVNDNSTRGCRPLCHASSK
ncbi:MAG TPA: hypothetical protein PLV92_12165 [Pirellulaceae bacterium]|nr:hypothetical protein [Pirellulaceae bacterium]